MLEQLLEILVYPGFMFAAVLGLLYLGVDRKLLARLQNRVGPPVWQNFLDFFKLMTKESLKPEGTSSLFFASPTMVLAALLAATLAIPIVGSVVFPALDNVILIMYLLLMASAFTIIAGFSSGNPFAVVGAVRKLGMMLAVEFPLLVALFVAVMAAHSLSLTGIMMFESANGMLALSFPLATIAFLIAAQGELARAPFDIYEAKQEIVAGPYTEYSGGALAVFELAFAIKFFVIISLAVVLFFGGAATLWMFLVKFFAIGILITFIRAIFARLRIAQALKFYWLFVGPLALIDLIRVMFL